MTIDPRALSRALTEAVVAVPAVRTVVPPGPTLPSLVRDLRSALDLPRDGGAVLVGLRAERPRIRVTVGVDGGVSTITTLRAVRDTIIAGVAAVLDTATIDLTVRVVEIV